MKWEEIVCALEFLKVPSIVVTAIIVAFIGLQIILNILELNGKIVLEWINIKKRIQQKKQKKQESVELLKEVRTLLNDVNSRYSEDNINKRDVWINDVDTDRDWMHQRADIYDQSIIEIKDGLLAAANQLKENTIMIEDMFVENSRDRIIDFAEKASDNDAILSHEQFRRVFRVHEDYEKFLKAHKRTNGEVDTAYEMIQDGFKYRMKNHCFAEDIKGYPKK